MVDDYGNFKYDSPVEICYNDTFKNLVKETDDYIINAIEVSLGCKVDKDELIKALNYDRKQYEKGYKDGRESIIRCIDCKYFDEGCCMSFRGGLELCDVDDFCSCAERRAEDG